MHGYQTVIFSLCISMCRVQKCYGCLFTEILCANLPGLHHGMIDQKQSSFLNDKATVKCDDGYRFLEGYTQMELQCFSNSNWNYSLSTLSCAGNRYSENVYMYANPRNITLVLISAHNMSNHILHFRQEMPSSA